MKYKKAINILVILIAVLALAGCLAGFLAGGGSGSYDYKSIRGETVKIYGSGLYQYDSVAVVAQGKAQDVVTVIMGIPLLLASLYFSNRGSFRGRLMLTGTLGYFLYSYISYTFLWTYNPLFLLYTTVMSLSLFAFILCFLTFDIGKMPEQFHKELPVKFLGGFQIAIGILLSLLWLGRIVPTIIDSSAPVGLEHYTTLVIQGMDLGIIVPTAFISGILLIKRKPFGYLLSSVVITKAFTMTTCMTAMIINQLLQNVNMSITEIILFPVFNLFAVFCLILLMKHTAGTVLDKQIRIS
jgi:hypothetical protein